jgi:phosphoribosylaminoimidazolecarboxamide formyltransferase / IMP cyclohydrolase
MTETNNQGLVKIRRALISVSDKTGIAEFARELKRFGVEIISTGGTAKTLREAGLEVRDVSDVTGFPEMMDGRIKTLHPKIHGALLSVRDNPEHQAAMREHDIEPIDMVVINLYPFEETIGREGVTLEEAIEQIDIGGPAMIRSAAKNFRDVAVVSSPHSYEVLAGEMNKSGGALSLETRQYLARDAFSRTYAYDSAITTYLSIRALKERDLKVGEAIERFFVKQDHGLAQPEEPGLFVRLWLSKIADLRYGENPHQRGALYAANADLREADRYLETGNVTFAAVVSGKEMSFNNYVDADAAWQLVCDFDDLACAIIKHTNPAGVALGSTTEEAYRKALACDPVSAFGGIVAFNRAVDEAAARAVTEIFVEVVVAPDYETAALEVLKTKKNLRVLRTGQPKPTEGLEYKQISGGMLVQTRDTHRLKREDLRVVTKRAPSEKEIDDLLFAWTVCKHTKSNAIVYARAKRTVGVGAGQMSRVDSVKLGAMRAQLPIKASVLASDAFFPFRDGVDEAAKHGITAVIQPGGSVRDEEVIAAANEHGLAMVFTGVRHFKH